MKCLFYVTVSAIAAIISFSFFVSVAVIIEEYHGFVTYQPTQQHYNTENDKGFLHVFFHDPTAFFTGALFFATVALAAATIALIVITQRGIRDQSRVSNDSMKVALRAADAAMQSAAAERAWLTFSNFDTGEYIDGRLNDEFIKKGILINVNSSTPEKAPLLLEFLLLDRQYSPSMDLSQRLNRTSLTTAPPRLLVPECHSLQIFSFSMMLRPSSS